jgi:hypothetical protein
MRMGLPAAVITAVLASTAALPAAGRLAQAQRQTAASGLDAAFAAFWSAPDPAAAATAAQAIARSGAGYDDVRARLANGRAYAAAERGVVRLSHRIGSDEFGYTLDVPAAYDPSRRYQVRIQLHGGVGGRQDGSIRGSGGIGSLAGAEQIYVLPNAWNDVPWWGPKQLESLRVILDRLKRTYNVDENHVVVSGVSDGGTSAYYVAMHETTPFSSFLPLNGALLVLTNDSLNIDTDLLPNNLLNKPFFVVNGGKDPLYPPEIVEPYVDHLRRGGVDLEYRPQPDGVHNTAWWPEVKDSFEAFVTSHPRSPHPAKLTWETDGKDTSRRAHWLVIETLRQNDTRPPLPDLNRLTPPPLAGFGLRVDGNKVLGVTPASSASSFDLKAGDVILSVEGREIPAGQTILPFLQTFPPNGLLTFGVQRGAERVDLRGYFSPGSSSPRPIFRQGGPIGRVDLVRTGNTIDATTRGVDTFRLLLSADVIDFAKPVKVVVDGKPLFDGMVKKDLATLLEWAARDNDRTMLYDAALALTVPR